MMPTNVPSGTPNNNADTAKEDGISLTPSEWATAKDSLTIVHYMNDYSSLNLAMFEEARAAWIRQFGWAPSKAEMMQAKVRSQEYRQQHGRHINALSTNHWIDARKSAYDRRGEAAVWDENCDCVETGGEERAEEGKKLGEKVGSGMVNKLEGSRNESSSLKPEVEGKKSLITKSIEYESGGTTILRSLQNAMPLATKKSKEDIPSTNPEANDDKVKIQSGSLSMDNNTTLGTTLNPHSVSTLEQETTSPEDPQKKAIYDTASSPLNTCSIPSRKRTRSPSVSVEPIPTAKKNRVMAFGGPQEREERTQEREE
jgi:hypothetical protein